ncbi:MAG: M6 family metalloprotease domain-containing protein [Candidatus Cloacimonetes bacterium]|nr:M6 family metalloprotease domain-containing protein [Candidatus Cloacimonadota bacterium]
MIQNITIFIRFSNQNEFDTPLTLYDTFLNPTAPGVNSLYRYYWDASYNQLEVYSTFYPTPNGTSIVSYQDQYPRNYYMPYNETSNPEGYTGANEYSRRVTLLRNALEYAEQFIPSTLIIDGDGDGVIDNINFIVRGNSGAWADLLWPHMSNLYNANILVHGVRAGTYNFNMEDRASSSGVGVFAHEFGHSLGVPDFYRYNYNGTPVGGWDLMASDRNPPQSFSSSNKAKYLNWIPPLRTITANGTYTLVPNTVDGAECSYRINSPNSTTEYFVIEYRSRSTGLTDSNLSGEGLLVYRVNSLRNGNAQGPPDEIYYYRAGGTPNSDGTISNAAYSLESNRTAINDYTNPSSFLGNGNPGGLNIYNISALGETMTFTVNITGPDPSHFSESFESQTFTNFDWQNNSASPWSIVSDPTAPHGSYVATSGQIDAGQTSRLEIQLHHDNGYIQFHLKTSSAPDSGYLKFYMDGAELGSWSGNTIWTSFAMPVVAGPHHYAWVYQRTTAASGGENKVWIDRIGFPDYTGYILYPPQNLSANAVERVVTVNWQAPYVTVAPNPPTVLGYNLYVGNTLVNTTLINNTTYTINNAGGGNMRFTTKAIYEAGESDFSNDETINIPLAPATILAAYSHGRGVRIDWDYEYISYNLATFRIYKNGTLMTISGLSGSSRTYLDTAVTEGENYSYLSVLPTQTP